MYGTTELCDGIGIKPFQTLGYDFFRNIAGVYFLFRKSDWFLLILGILQDTATFLGILHGYWTTVRNYASILIRNFAC